MTEWTTPEALDLGAYIRPGDAVMSGQACGEPTALIEALIAQRWAQAQAGEVIGHAGNPTARHRWTQWLT